MNLNDVQKGNTLIYLHLNNTIAIVSLFESMFFVAMALYFASLRP